jgi:regulator of nucleoside diphosphate kinase
MLRQDLPEEDMTDINDTGLPDIVIRATDEERLAALAATMLGSKPELAEELLSELARARLASGEALPVDTVQMGSTLTYEADGRQRRVTLVYPQDADIDAGRISVLTPIDTALIGLAEGQSIEWTSRDGRRQRLTVVAVERGAAA